MKGPRRKNPRSKPQKSSEQFPKQQGFSGIREIAATSAILICLVAALLQFYVVTPMREVFRPRTDPLPVLDQLFPFQSLDTAWEKHPLLSTIYRSEEGVCQTTDGQCSASGQQEIRFGGNRIPTVYLADEDTKHEERLSLTQDLISREDIDQVLHPPNHQQLVHGTDYKLIKKILRDGEEWTGSLPDERVSTPEQQQVAFAQGGFSLIINQLQKRWGPVAQFARLLEQESLPKHVTCNLYMTPPPGEGKSQQAGFESHWDWMDVVVLQLSGEKLWSVAKRPQMELSNQDQKHKPLLEDMDKYLSLKTGRYEEFLLRPGDVLYIPRGFIHNASTVGLDYENVKGPRFHETPSLHLTFGMEHGCQTTVEALLHHAIETHAASGGTGAKMAIPSRDCPMAAGRDIPWKDVLHFAVAEVARRQDMCKKGSSKNNCILRQSVAIQPGLKQLALSRSQGSSLVHGDEAVKGTLLEALSVVHALVEPDHLARFVWRLEVGDEESIRTFCHPFISRQSSAPCPDALAQVNKRALRSYASDLRDFASKHFNVIQQQFEGHVQRMRLATWNEEDELLKLVGQWASLETHT
jgi:hypothetical protein